MHKKIIVVVVVLLLLLKTINVNADQYAYMFSDNSIQKFNLNSNTLVSKIAGETNMVGYTDIPYGYSAIDFDNQYFIKCIDSGVIIYDIRTLKMISKVSVQDSNIMGSRTKILYPSTGNVFYLVIFNIPLEDDLDVTNKVVSVDKKTFAIIKTLDAIPLDIEDKIYISADNKFFVKQDSVVIKYDLIGMVKVEEYNLANYYSLNSSERAITDIQNGMILMGEVVNGRWYWFVYDANNKTVTNKYMLEISNTDQELIVGNNRVLFMDTGNINDSAGMPLKKGTITQYRLLIYDTTDGKQMFNKTLSGISNGKIVNSTDNVIILKIPADGVNDKILRIDIMTSKILNEAIVPKFKTMLIRNE